jgi:hypothetical protein
MARVSKSRRIRSRGFHRSGEPCAEWRRGVLSPQDERGRPPSPLRGYGATAFACIHERRDFGSVAGLPAVARSMAARPTVAATPRWWATSAYIHERRLVGRPGIEPGTP